MWRIADGGGIEQRGRSFLHQRTYTLSPYSQIETMRTRRQIHGTGPAPVGTHVVMPIFRETQMPQKAQVHVD
jgi:hypothetical protein